MKKMARIPRRNLIFFVLGAVCGLLFSKSSYYARLFQQSAPLSLQLEVDENEVTTVVRASSSINTNGNSGSNQTQELDNYESADHEPPGEDVDDDDYEVESSIEAYKLTPLRDASQKCPYESVDLAPQAKPMTSYKPTSADIDEMMRQLGVKNGCYTPVDCVPVEKVAIIIPFKDREDHLVKWLFHMHQLLVRQRRQYCVIVAEPIGSGHFNKGSTMNAAVRESISEGFDCVILHDVDMMLENGHNIYQCQEQPTQLCPFIDKFNYKDHYGTEFGGVTMLKPEQYIKANGYSNLYWGWGKEDDDMAFRIKQSGQLASKPVNYDAGRYSMIPHQHPWAFRNNKNTDKDSDLRFLSLSNIGNNRYRYAYEGYNSLKYKVTQTELESSHRKIYVDFRPLDIFRAKLTHKASNMEITMDPKNIDDRGYVELKDTYICQMYGFSSVMKWLHKWRASKNSAIDKCNWFPDFCVDVVEMGTNYTDNRTVMDFTLREVSQLVSGVTARKPGGCELKAHNPIVLHKQVYGEQRRLHVIEQAIQLETQQRFNFKFDYNDVNGPEKGVYYRHALIWEGQQIKGVQHIELVAPMTVTDGPRAGEQSFDFDIGIDTPVPGWYTVLSKVTDCIGQPIFELRWAFRVVTGDKIKDDQIISSTDPGATFHGDEWGVGIPPVVFKQSLQKYYENATT